MASSLSGSNLPDNYSLYEYDAALQGLAWKNVFGGSRKEWTVALCSRFVVYFAAGNPNLDIFCAFLAQNLHFLRAIANAYQVVEKRVGDDTQLGIPEMRDSRNPLLSRNIWQSNFLTSSRWNTQELGLEPNIIKEKPSYAATVKYTEFLLATTSGEIDGAADPSKTMLAAYIVGAITPYARLFAFICSEFAHLSQDIHPYQPWIACRSYEDGAKKTEELLHKLSASLSEEERRIIKNVYLQAMKLVVDFFLAQPIANRTVVHLSKQHNPAQDLLGLCSDFDLTCTAVNSSEILKEIAIETASKTEQNQSGDQLAQMSSVQLRTKWEGLFHENTQEYKHCINQILSSEAYENFNEESLAAALDRISEVEKKAIPRFEKSQILKGLSIDDIRRGGERLNLQDGCADFFLDVIGNENLNAQIFILSDSWCSEMAKSAFSSPGLGGVHIQGNELVLDNSSSLSTGEILKKVKSLSDKLKLFKFSADMQRICNKDKKVVTVYIGDGVDDLLCLLMADIGIVIESSSTSPSDLIILGSHFGVSFEPLSRLLVAKQKEAEDGGAPCWKGGEGVVYTVSGWREIHAFILGTFFLLKGFHSLARKSA